MKKISLVALVLLTALAQAQTVNHDVLDTAHFVAPIRSDGQLFQAPGWIFGLEYPKTSVTQDERFIAYTGHIWFGGVDSGGFAHMAAETYGQSGRSYYPGLSRFDPALWDTVWKVTRAEVDQFRADFANQTVNFAHYPIVAHWPAFGLDINGMPKACAPFVDMDNDPAHYTPTAGDYPDFPGDQAIYFQFTDDPGLQTPHLNPLGFEVRAFAYAYGCPELQDVLFLRYSLTNPTTTAYSNFRMGLWMDFDIGNYADDYLGTDTLRGLLFGYNGDPNDETVAGYGLYPPAMGITCLSQPVGGAMYYHNHSSATGNPQTTAEHYHYLNQRWKDGTDLVDNGSDGHTGSGAGPATRYPFPGDPGWCSVPGTGGWSEVSAGNQPFDRRGLISTAPSTFATGEVRSYTLAVLMARANYHDQYGSVCELMELTDSLRSWWDSGHLPCEGTATGILPPLPSSEAVQLFPNPAQDRCTLLFQRPSHKPATVQVLDMTGREVLAVEGVRGERVTLDVQDLCAGVYSVRVCSEGKVFTGKLVIDR